MSSWWSPSATSTHWHDDAAMARATERQKMRFFRWAREQIAPYQNQRREPKGEVFPGVTAVPLYGHTPGHTGYLVASKGREGSARRLVVDDVVPPEQLRSELVRRFAYYRARPEDPLPAKKRGIRPV